MAQQHRKNAMLLLSGPEPRGHPSDVFPTATGQVPGAAIRDNEGTAVSSRRRFGRAESLVYAAIRYWAPASLVVSAGRIRCRRQCPVLSFAQGTPSRPRPRLRCRVTLATLFHDFALGRHRRC